jgi:hypothetical protein
MSRAVIIAALLQLFPHLKGTGKAETYAFLIKLESERSGVAIKYIVGRTYIESRFHNVKSKRFGCRWRKVPSYRKGPVYYCRQSFGIMQSEITPVTNPVFMGFEEEFMNEAIAFRVGTAALAYWQNWHRRKCKKRGKHRCRGPWFLHYKYGYKIPKKKQRKPGKRYKMERFMRKWQRLIRRLKAKRNMS